MAKKKGQEQPNKGARPTASGSADLNSENQPKSEASQLNTKAQEKSNSSLKQVPKGKQHTGDGAGAAKAVQAKEPMNKENSKDSQKSSFADTVGNILQFLKEVNVERRKISWPGRDQVIRETWSVLFLVAIITGLVLGFDWLIGHLIFGPLEHWARLHGGGIGRG